MNMMKSLASIFALGLASCVPSPLSIAPLSGKYQSEDGNLGIEFLEGDDAVFYGGQLDKYKVKYAVFKGKDGLRLKIEYGPSSIVTDLEKNHNISVIMDLKKERGFITLNDAGNEIILQKVDKLTVPSLNEIEAKNYVFSLNGTQRSSYLRNDRFSDKPAQGILGANAETENFIYSTSVPTPNVAISMGIPKADNLRAFIGGVFAIKTPKNHSKIIPPSILCQATTPGVVPDSPFLEGDRPTCADGAIEIVRCTLKGCIWGKE